MSTYLFPAEIVNRKKMELMFSKHFSCSKKNTMEMHEYITYGSLHPNTIVQTVFSTWYICQPFVHFQFGVILPPIKRPRVKEGRLHQEHKRRG